MREASRRATSACANACAGSSSRSRAVATSRRATASATGRAKTRSSARISLWRSDAETPSGIPGDVSCRRATRSAPRVRFPDHADPADCDHDASPCPRLSLAVSADDAAIAAGTFAEPLSRVLTNAVPSPMRRCLVRRRAGHAGPSLIGDKCGAGVRHAVRVQGRGEKNDRPVPDPRENRRLYRRGRRTRCRGYSPARPRRGVGDLPPAILGSRDLSFLPPAAAAGATRARSTPIAREWTCTLRESVRRCPTLPHPAGAVPSALEGLASGFGMGPGVSPPLWPP